MRHCTRCGLPLPDKEKGGRHYDPDECVRLLQAKEKAANEELQRIIGILNEMALPLDAYVERLDRHP